LSLAKSPTVTASAFVSDAMAFGAFHDGSPSSLAAQRSMRSRSFVSQRSAVIFDSKVTGAKCRRRSGPT
jgi:hypothetical protein